MLNIRSFVKGVDEPVWVEVLNLACARAILDVDDFNPTKAIKLYEKVGFKVAKKYLKYERRL